MPGRSGVAGAVTDPATTRPARAVREPAARRRIPDTDRGVPMALPPLVEPAAGLSKEEVERYSRHLIIPDVGMTGQKRLKNAKVLVVGAGGLGSPALLYLAAAGVGTLGIVDFDVVDESNLQRQVIHGQSDVGRPKAESARDSILEINPLVNVVVHNTRLDNDTVMEIFSAYDLIVDGTDNFATRYMVNDARAMPDPTVQVRKDPACGGCGKNPTITELIDYEAFCGAVSEEAAEAVQGSTISAKDLAAMLDAGDNIFLVDVREPNEYEIVSIPGATLIPKGEFLSGAALEKLPQDKRIVLHCKSGARSAEALAIVKNADFTDAVHVGGGVLAWISQVDPSLPSY